MSRPGIQRARGAAGLLDDQQVDRPAAGGDGPAQLLAIEAFAAQRHQQHGADVRMRAQPLHHLERILVGITAGEADEVHVVGAGLLHDEARDVMRAFDEVGHRDHVADALAAILAQEILSSKRLVFATAFINVRPSSCPCRVRSRAGSRCAGCAGARVRRAPPQSSWSRWVRRT